MNVQNLLSTSLKSQSYPLVLVSPAVSEALQSLPSPVPPYRPGLAPDKPKEQPLPRLRLWLETGVGGLGAIVLYSLLRSALGLNVALLLGSAALGGVGFRVLQMLRRNRRLEARQRQYEWQLADYMRQEDTARREYRKQVQDRDEILNQPRRLHAFRSARLLPLFAEIPCRRAHQPSNAETPEAPEAKLWEQLKRDFGERLYQGQDLRIEGLPSGWSPTFVYIDPQLKLHVDLEIDRAFDFDPATGSCEPRNFIGGARNGEHALLDQNWLVLRLTPEQALNQTRSCCKVLAEVIAGITGDRLLVAGFNGVPDLDPVPCWTAEQAMAMARRALSRRTVKA